jgi:hypothetical protein
MMIIAHRVCVLCDSGGGSRAYYYSVEDRQLI